ncbi:hypothetical protein ACF06X_33730 [Streptomyces sp. NPDC015346]|uniref:hypothetical protein n=1 Tax=Streptomyces sp. NPDC015346 TaxID=3364954 RepID=UPI0036FC9F41
MSKNQKATVLMLAAVAAQVYAGRIAKQQAAVLGLPVIVLALAGMAAGAVL